MLVHMYIVADIASISHDHIQYGLQSLVNVFCIAIKQIEIKSNTTSTTRYQHPLIPPLYILVIFLLAHTTPYYCVNNDYTRAKTFAIDSEHFMLLLKLYVYHIMLRMIVPSTLKKHFP